MSAPFTSHGQGLCPFCGCSQVTYLWSEYTNKRGAKKSNCRIVCEECTASTGYFRSTKDAEIAWNTRYRDMSHPRVWVDKPADSDCPYGTVRDFPSKKGDKDD